MTRSPEYWRRKYERAEAERLAIAGELAAATRQRIDTAADDLQHQVTALEQLVLNRAALTNIERDGNKVRFTFTRRGAVHQCVTYGTWDQPVDEWRLALLGDGA